MRSLLFKFLHVWLWLKSAALCVRAADNSIIQVHVTETQIRIKIENSVRLKAKLVWAQSTHDDVSQFRFKLHLCRDFPPPSRQQHVVMMGGETEQREVKIEWEKKFVQNFQGF